MDPHRLGEERSIALHARVAELLRADPQLLEKARERVEEWGRTGSVPDRYVRGWRALLSHPIDALCAALIDESEAARALRQTSPFAGIVPARERWRIRKEVAARLGALS